MDKADEVKKRSETARDVDLQDPTPVPNNGVSTFEFEHWLPKLRLSP